MIDTIVLMLKQNMFTILDHSKFNPSTSELYNSVGLGGQLYKKCVQNPTRDELKRGIYKPRLTVTKRVSRQGFYEITLRIEFSAPKLLYENNFDELVDSNFMEVVARLKIVLRNMGVGIFESSLVNAP
ncbi:MAG: hypothetical protein KKB22_04205, partial [Candidatus Omnitrophica bacterium]|nr:hypothetical protein [Candidatus Omnitrophota bacterium]